MTKLLIGAGLVVAIAVAAPLVNLIGCGGGCDASTFVPACNADNTATTACIFGLDATQSCAENKGAGSACCVVNSDPRCAWAVGEDCTWDSDCCTDNCDSATSKCAN